MDGFLSWQGNQEGIPGQGRSSLLDGEGGEAASVCGKEILGYSSIEKVRFQTLYGRLEIFGIISCEIFRHGKAGTLEEHPTYKKTAKAAASALLKEHNSPDRVEQLLATLERYTGRKVDRYDPSHRR